MTPPSPPLDNIRVMVIVWRLRGNIIRSAPCWVVWHNVHSQQHTHMSSSYRSRRYWDPYAMHRGGCLELYYCNMVEWSWWDSGLICKTYWFPLLVWLYDLYLKIVPDMTYNVFGGTLNLAQPICASPTLTQLSVVLIRIQNSSKVFWLYSSHWMFGY